jgi:hypothetical protein
LETGRYLDTEIDLAPDLECISPARQQDSFRRIRPAEVAKQVSAAVVAASR